MIRIHSVRSLVLLALAAASTSAMANGIAYISSASGYMLHGSGGATLADWRGQAPISFAGYGQLKQGSQCLSGSQGGQQLRWEGCRSGDKGQIWKLSGNKLNNELGYCADVEGGRQAAGARVLAYQCHGGGNQQWRGHAAKSAQSVASGISNSAVRAKFISTANSAPAGSLISTSTGMVVSGGGANVVSAGGLNVIAVGGGNVVSAGGAN